MIEDAIDKSIRLFYEERKTNKLIREINSSRKQQCLTLEYLKNILFYNEKTGFWIWINKTSKFSNINVGDRAGTLDEKGYIVITIKGKRYYAHVLAWFYMTGEWPKDEIDHRDLDKANNKWLNFRLSNRLQNCSHRLKNTNNTSGFKGVYFDKRANKLRVRITVNNELKCVGSFTNIIRAAQA